MGIKERIENLEIRLQTKLPGCNPTLYFVVPEEMQHGPFDPDSYKQSKDEIEKYLKQLKNGGQCRDCKGPVR